MLVVSIGNKKLTIARELVSDRAEFQIDYPKRAKNHF